MNAGRGIRGFRGLVVVSRGRHLASRPVAHRKGAGVSPVRRSNWAVWEGKAPENPYVPEAAPMPATAVVDPVWRRRLLNVLAMSSTVCFLALAVAVFLIWGGR